ncbi:MerR family DNA-binding protein [Bacillus sp. DJP31]|uniref:MerR family DNA-binding protein n=1 Tax=Bacillus sp. DJP31 TaxID=3409789 RepID=UPI003BB54314
MMRNTQMPLAKIRVYAELYVEGDHTTNARLKLLEDHRNSIQNQIQNLVSTEIMLGGKIVAYKEFLRNNVDKAKDQQKK